MRIEIHPHVGIARVGNSPSGFYLAPDRIGGLPTECGPGGDEVVGQGEPVPVNHFKDAEGRIKRQAARFRVFVYDEESPGGREAVVGQDVRAIEWTAHLASKKAAWYNFAELEGDLMLGPENSYANRGVPLRNAGTTGADRQKLLIDFGPRTVCHPGVRVGFDRESVPEGYPAQFPEGTPSQGEAIQSLGELLVDSRGRLLVLGGFGKAGGDQPISSFAGADTWHDDISDGPVRCKVTLTDGRVVELDAWVIVGSPKFAPELVNIVTLDDIMFDVGVRYHQLAPDMYDPTRWPATRGWNPDYPANFERDIWPIIRRPAGYQWVANVPSMTAFAMPPFDPRDASPALLEARRTYFRYWRKPGDTEVTTDGQENDLLGPAGVPLMPLNSGTNSVSNALIDKFLTLTLTQYFLLGQWAEGKFKVGAADDLGIHPLDRASVGNAVGSPMCPGIEVTWSTRNPAIYARPYVIAHDKTDYFQHGLDPGRDETVAGSCQPGDLTKRMAIPWQADFFQCTVQFINFSDPGQNKSAAGIPLPPTYYAYWWPPQSPMFVMTPIANAHVQLALGVPSGFQVYYSRGVNTFAEMIAAWSYLGFVANRNTAPERSDYPAFEEVERNHDKFIASSVAVGNVDNFVSNTDSFFTPMWFLRNEAVDGVPSPAGALAVAAEPTREGPRPVVTIGVGRHHRSLRG